MKPQACRLVALASVPMLWLLPAHLAPAASLTAGQYQAIYSFKGPPDGADPVAGLVADPQGRLYGTTAAGGASNGGTVFRLTQPASGASPWTEDILHSFGSLPNYADGCQPEAPVALGADGSVYGTALCGIYGTTLVFKLSNVPGWPETILHNFNPADGSYSAVTGVVFGPSGLLYGTSSSGYGGAAFYVSPLGDQVAFSYIHRFGTAGDGKYPTALMGVPTNYFPGFVGTTTMGGTSNLGTVFALQPSSSGGAAFESVLSSFGPAPDVNNAFEPPFAGTGAIHKGLYGCASSGGTHNGGGIYALLPTGSFGLAESVLYNFGDRRSDVGPTFNNLSCGLEQANSAGLLVGTAGLGGRYGGGGFFELDPPTTPGGAWTEKVDISFDPQNPAGSYPLGTPLKIGNLYVGSMSRSPSGFGTIYQLTP